MLFPQARHKLVWRHSIAFKGTLLTTALTIAQIAKSLIKRWRCISNVLCPTHIPPIFRTAAFCVKWPRQYALQWHRCAYDRTSKFAKLGSICEYTIESRAKPKWFNCMRSLEQNFFFRLSDSHRIALSRRLFSSVCGFRHHSSPALWTPQQHSTTKRASAFFFHDFPYKSILCTAYKMHKKITNCETASIRKQKSCCKINLTAESNLW